MMTVRSLLFFSLSSLSAWGGTVFSENFASATAGLYGAGILPGTGFSVVSGSVDINAGAQYGWLCAAPATGFCLDTTGSTSSVPGRGVFETTLAYLVQGPTSISFSLVRWNDTVNGGGPQDASVTVTFGGLFSETFTVDGSFSNTTILRNFNVPVATSAKLRFTDNSGTLHAAGAVVDNVVITSAIPEPSTLTLAGLSLLLGAIARRRSA